MRRHEALEYELLANPESRIPNPEPRVPSPESRVPLLVTKCSDGIESSRALCGEQGGDERDDDEQDTDTQ